MERRKGAPGVRLAVAVLGGAGVLAGAVAVAFWAGPARADAVERACLSSGRSAASRELCGCIQQAADLTLTPRDQATAARLMRDPARAEEVRRSQNRTHSAFWERYRNFGATAEAYCSGT